MVIWIRLPWETSIFLWWVASRSEFAPQCSNGGRDGPRLFNLEHMYYKLIRTPSQSSAKSHQESPTHHCPHFAHKTCQPQGIRGNAKAGTSRDETMCQGPAAFNSV